MLAPIAVILGVLGLSYAKKHPTAGGTATRSSASSWTLSRSDIWSSSVVDVSRDKLEDDHELSHRVADRDPARTWRSPSASAAVAARRLTAMVAAVGRFVVLTPRRADRHPRHHDGQAVRGRRATSEVSPSCRQEMVEGRRGRHVERDEDASDKKTSREEVATIERRASDAMTRSRIAVETLTMRLLAAALASLALARVAPPNSQSCPATSTLTGPHAAQRLLVVDDDGRRRRRRPHRAGDVHLVGPDGRDRRRRRHRPRRRRRRGDHHRHGRRQHGDRARSRSTKTKEPFAWSFRNHVIPVLTRLGCNSGACHGALAGKGGLKLSLRGYDPDADHFVLTRQALRPPRRPRRSRTRACCCSSRRWPLPHGGGLKLEVDSPEYRVLADWIAAGAPGPKADDAAHRAAGGLPAAGRAQAEGQAAGPRPGLVHRRPRRGRDALGQVRLQRGPGRRRRRRRPGHRRRPRRGGGQRAVRQPRRRRDASSSPFAEHGRCRRCSPQSPRHNFIDDLVLKKLAAPATSRRRRPCTDAEFIRRAYLDAAGILPTPEEVETFLADKSPRQAGEADRRAAGAAGVRRLLGVQVVGPAADLDAAAAAAGDVGVLPVRPPERGRQQAVGPLRPRHPDRPAAAPAERGGQLLRPAQGRRRPDRGDGGHVPGHVDHLLPLPQPSAGEMDPGPVLGMANLFAPRRPEERRPGRRGARAVAARRRRACTRAAASPMPPTPLDGKPLPLDSTDRPPRVLRRLADGAGQPVLRQGRWSTASGATSWAAAWSRPRTTCAQTNPPTNAELLDALAKDFVKHEYDVKHLIRTIMNSAAYQRSSSRCRRTRPTTASTRATWSAGCRPR